MNVTIIGTGNMARAIAKRMLAGGNNVTLLSRTPDKAATLIKELSLSAKKGATIKAAALGTPISDPVVFSTVWYAVSLDILKMYGDQLSGKVLVDTSNPLNQTYDDLATPAGSSAAEEIAKAAAKGVKVLKAFNTNFAGLISQGHVAGQPLDVFIAGDDADAKATLAKLIGEGGQHAIDAGPLKRARQLEGMGLLSITLQSKHDKPWMNSVKLMA